MVLQNKHVYGQIILMPQFIQFWKVDDLFV